MKTYYVYIMASMANATIYVGVTNSLERRVQEHKEKLIRGFTQRYNCVKLVYFEEFGDIAEAIMREKELKGWRRSKKVALIEKMSPDWRDLSQDWY
ncbi:MAG TPA: GIY-YIG nuclease family protein [Bacteroidota bacterium]|nr:GIY-YIG nuclease family protein [Bacteroidota bacterium]